MRKTGSFWLPGSRTHFRCTWSCRDICGFRYVSAQTISTERKKSLLQTVLRLGHTQLFVKPKDQESMVM